MNIEHWPIASILALKSPFCFTEGPVPDKLRKSIRSAGILHEPVIRRNHGGRDAELVHGERRVRILHESRPDAVIAVKVYEPGGLTDEQAFRMNFIENIATRSLNPMEKSNALYILVHVLKEPLSSILRDYAEMMDLPPRKDVIEQYLTIHKASPESRAMVATGALQPDTAAFMQAFQSADAVLVLQWIRMLRLGVNAQKTLVKLVWEIHRKTGRSLISIAEEDGYPRILQKDWTASQKWTQIEGALRRRRYPALTGLEERFRTLRKTLKLPPRITLQNPPYFESEDFIVHFRFKSLSEYRNYLSSLQSAGEQPEFEEIFRLSSV